MKNTKMRRSTRRGIVKIYNPAEVAAVENVTAIDLGIDYKEVKVAYTITETIDVVAPRGVSLGDGCYRVSAAAAAE